MANLFGTGGQFGGGILNPNSFQMMLPYITRYYGQGYKLPGDLQSTIQQGTSIGQLPSGGNPQSVLGAALPRMQEQVQQGYANAGQRFGKSGMLGSGYATALGQSQRGALNDLSQLYMQYMYNAAEGSANRALQARLAEMSNQLQAGLTQGEWGNQGWQQGANLLGNLAQQQLGFDQRNAELNRAYAEQDKAPYSYAPGAGTPTESTAGKGQYGGYDSYQQWMDAWNAQQRARSMQNLATSFSPPATYNAPQYWGQTIATKPADQGITPDQQAMNEQALQARIKDFWRSYYGGLPSYQRGGGY